MATSLRTVTSAMALRPSIAGPSLHGDGVPILYAIGALLASRSPSSVECNTNRAAASSSPGDCAPILSAIRSLVSSSSSSREGNSIRASSSGDGAPIMTAIRSLVSSSSSSREGNAILAANGSSAGDCSPITSVIRALIGASSLSELGSFSIYQGSAYASRELVPVYQGSAYGFRELVPASYRSFHPCKVLPASLTSNRNSSLMLVNILLGAWFGGYVLASTDGQPGSIILENLKEKLKLIEAEITDLERMIEEFGDASDFMKLMKQKLERLKVLKEDLLKLLEDFQAVDDGLRKMLDELSADKDLTKEDLAVISKKLMELEAPPEKENFWKEILTFGKNLLQAPSLAIGLHGTLDEVLTSWLVIFSLFGAGLHFTQTDINDLWERKKKRINQGVMKILGKRPGTGICFCHIVLPVVCSHCGTDLPQYVPEEPLWWEKK